MNDPESTTERIARLYLAVFNDRKLEVLGDLLTPDFVSHLRVGDLHGIPAFRATLEGFYTAFPDVRWLVDEWVFTPGRAVCRYHWEGTQRAPWLGIPATNKLVRAEGLELMHIRQGQLAEVWNYSDIMGVAAQLQARSPLEIEL